LLGPVRIASRWFPPQSMAMITGLIVTVAMVGGMVAQYPMTYLVSQIGWRDAVWVVGWIGVVMWVFMGLGILDKPTKEKISQTQPLRFWEVIKRAYTNPETLRVALFGSLMNMAIAVFGAMMGSLYLMERLDISKELAASINGMLFLGTILGGPLMGRWSDRLGIRLLPMRVGAIGALFVLLVVLYVPCSPWVMYVLFFALGFFTSAQVISYAYVAESHPHSMTATAVSLVSICTQGGYVVFQNLFSHILLWHGQNHAQVPAMAYALADYQVAAIMLPIGLVIAWFLLLRLRETYCHSEFH
jgi:MFS family permease